MTTCGWPCSTGSWRWKFLPRFDLQAFNGDDYDDHLDYEYRDEVADALFEIPVTAQGPDPPAKPHPGRRVRGHRPRPAGPPRRAAVAHAQPRAGPRALTGILQPLAGLQLDEIDLDTNGHGTGVEPLFDFAPLEHMTSLRTLRFRRSVRSGPAPVATAFDNARVLAVLRDRDVRVDIA